MFDPGKSAKIIKEDFIDYITTTLHFNDQNDGPDSLYEKFRDELEQIITKGPYIDINSAFLKGKTINELIDEKILSEKFRDLELNKSSNYKRELPLDRPLYRHQEKAIRILNNKENVVITTGTGSGKTECFMIPMIDSLLKEGEGLKEPGVRAILIYPMNALANDQMKRLRNILMKYPQIKFGVYNGDTPYRGDQSNWYKELHLNEIYDELKSGLPNELLTREQMALEPPHILCTNYAMLEYMLLTPNRGAVFANSKIKFIILDEAHTYSGATGMETSLLIRRLIARISANGNKPQYVLTSATLGERGYSENNINQFAENLTGEKFGLNNIIYGERDTSFNDKLIKEYPIGIFEDIVNNDSDNNKSLFEKYNISYDTNVSDKENLYNLCSSSTFYKIIRNNYFIPVELSEISSWLTLNEKDTVNFLHVCTLGYKNGAPLVDMRFHFFVRALEGLFHCFTGDKEIFLNRKEYVKHGDNDDRVFEISICKNCGDIAIVGYIKNQNGREFLLNRNNNFFDDAQEPEFYHIVMPDELGLDGSDVDVQEADEHDIEIEDNDDEEKRQIVNKTYENNLYTEFWLCPHCGEISEVSDGKPDCGYNVNDFIKLRKFSTKYKGMKEKCLKCFRGSYNRFYIGTEAATSVLATSLFEQLPIKKIKKIDSVGNEQIFEAGKQFLSFSDSRSEAAFFASYLDKTYEYMIGKRGLITILENEKRKILQSAQEDMNLDDYARKLTKLFEENETYNEDLLKEPNPRELKIKSSKAAWMIILKELISCKRNNSLQSLGLLTYKYLGNNASNVRYYKDKYFNDLSYEEVKSFLDELAMTFAYFGAIIVPEDDFNIELNEEDRRNLFWSSYKKGICEQKTSFAKPYYGNRLPMRHENDPTKYYKTYRQELTMRALGESASYEKADALLQEYFNFLISLDNECRAIAIDKNKKYYAMPTKSFTIRIPGCNDIKWYKCKKCGKITNINIRNKCSIMNCDGELLPISDINEIFERNHYIDFYKNDEGIKYLKKLIIKEHTAQLSKLDAVEYQTKFEKNNINALSCSTTFEMGVDVGELETVFLRDIPPSAANYSQRAGRAGRSKNSAAFVISYAKLSSHDFHYYEEPHEIICGNINPPFFKLDNQKIVFRHIYSTIFGYFFNKYPLFFEDEKGKQRDVNYFFNEYGFTQFKNLLINPPDDLKKLLHNSFIDLDSEFGISTFNNEWVLELIGENGRLTIAENEYRQTIKDFDEQIAIYERNPDLTGGDFVRKRKKWFNATSIIDFLVDNNIIPKYGFPVDVVELKIGGNEEAEKAGWQRDSNSGLRLSRDMSQAISDYAPGCKVIANNKMYTSRYISKYWKSGNKDFDHVYIAYCGNPDCRTLNASLVENPNDYHCKACGESMNGVKWEKAIYPKAGMITDGKKGESVPLKKPKKIYRSEYYFLERDNESSKKTIDIGSNLITIISSKKDEIIVTSSKNEPFYVCPSCGFTYGHYDVIKNKNGKIDKEAMKILKYGTAEKITLENPHMRPTGAECLCKTLEKKYLYHSFATDIVQIAFNDRNDISYETAISVLFALIKAAELELGVERNEISGVLRFDCTDYNTNYRFILFDNVPGGAGYVKRLADSSNGYENLKSVLIDAYENTRNCECDEHSSCYKCLRTYENQKFHDILSRGDVADFLEVYIGKDFKEITN